MSLRITNMEGNFQRLDGGAMFGNVPRALWQNWMPPDELGRIELATRGMLITDGKIKVLCETGIGCYLEPKLAQRFGVAHAREHMLLKSLASQGLQPSDIDYIILSHLHFDHAGGLLPPYAENSAHSLTPVFTKAKIITSRTAFERALKPHPRDRASFIPGLAETLQDSGRLLLIEDEQTHIEALWPEHLSFLFSHGHTPGQLHSLFRGDTYQLIFTGDLVPGEAWVHLPIAMGYDRFAELVGEEKKYLYEFLLSGMGEKELKPLLFFTHDPKYPAGVLCIDAKGRYSLTDKWPSLNDFKI